MECVTHSWAVDSIAESESNDETAQNLTMVRVQMKCQRQSFFSHNPHSTDCQTDLYANVVQALAGQIQELQVARSCHRFPSGLSGLVL